MELQATHWPGSTGSTSHGLSQGKLAATCGYQQDKAKGCFVLADFIAGEALCVLYLVQNPPHMPRLIPNPGSHPVPVL